VGKTFPAYFDAFARLTEPGTGDGDPASRADPGLAGDR
jgi:hypothetical protein